LLKLEGGEGKGNKVFGMHSKSLGSDLKNRQNTKKSIVLKNQKKMITANVVITFAGND